jgi:hypothetical protein
MIEKKNRGWPMTDNPLTPAEWLAFSSVDRDG